MIKFDSVTKRYDSSGRAALDDVSVNIDKGEFVFLIGPSGSGKSTFLQLMSREQRADSGDVWVTDYHLNSIPARKVPKLRQKIGFIFQDFRLLQNKTVFDNVAFCLEVIGKSRSEINLAVPAALHRVGLEGKAHRYPRELSGGEQQRVAIARATVNKPLLLLADEPTGNLDPDTAHEIMALLQKINRHGTTVVMSTHDAEAVNDMRKRVIELDLGRIQRDDAHGIYGVGR